jgi:hypothetical protein
MSASTWGDIFAGFRVHIGNLSAFVRKSQRVAASAWNSPVARTTAVEVGFEVEDEEEAVLEAAEGAGVEEAGVEGVLAPEFSAED